MKYAMVLVGVLMLVSLNLEAYQDRDLDGIEDSVDQCPNTPFDDYVDQLGCSVKKGASTYRTKGVFTLQIGTDISTDESYDTDSTLRLYANYRYEAFDISISNRRSINRAYTEDNSYSDNDIYISLGYFFNLSQSRLKFQIGTKIVDDVDTNNINSQQKGKFGSLYLDTQTLYDERENDYFASISTNIFLSSKHDLFLYYGYTVSGDSDLYDYEDYSSFSIGTGYMLTPHWYSAISYNYIGSIYPDGDAEKNLSWYNSYTLNQNFYLTAAYSYALEDFSYDNTFSLGVGIRF